MVDSKSNDVGISTGVQKSSKQRQIDNLKNGLGSTKEVLPSPPESRSRDENDDIQSKFPVTSPDAHIPDLNQLSHLYSNDYNGFVYTFRTWLFDVVLFLFNIVYSTFFREVEIRGGQNVPPLGVPTILVCAPHANQFIDPSLVMLKTRRLSGLRSRQVCFVTAASSFKKRIVSQFCYATGSIPVPRPQDNLKLVDENIKVYCTDLSNPSILTVKGINGVKPDLLKRFTKKSLIGLPNYLGNARINDIIDDNTLILQKPFDMNNEKILKILTDGTNFKYAPPIDNTKVFQSVFNHLDTRGCVGIFPEGGSHDRPSLLPIKAGVAIMALGATAADPSLNVAITPCGLNYFHREKFRSRAVIEYGEPIIVTGKMGQEYRENPRQTVSDLLDRIKNALFSLTVNAPDYDTLMTIQACRRLYQFPLPKNADKTTAKMAQAKARSLPVVVELNRRMLQGYKKYKKDPRVQQLMSSVKKYNSKLYSLGLKDHQVSKLKTGPLATLRAIAMLLTRCTQLFFMMFLSLPGYILFAPIFLTCRIISQKKAKEGLRKSLVKIKGTDLLATWKLIVALAMTPLLYWIYTITLLILLNSKNYKNLIGWLYILPFNSKLIQFFYFFSLLIFMSYTSLKTGEIGVGILKSLKPLFVSIISPKRKIIELQKTRKNLSNQITNTCNELGPTVFPDFEELVQEAMESLHGIADTKRLVSQRKRSLSVASELSNALSTVNSRGSLADVPIFADNYFKYNTPSTIYSSSNVTTEDEEDVILPNKKDIHNNNEKMKLNNKNDDVKTSKISEMVRKKWEKAENDKI